ncbi:MAG: spore coat protein [Chloroflexi bacterium]|nr:spore coat protein [Chloroflexota bacterium]
MLIKRSFFLIIFLIITSLMVACGSDETTPESSSDTSETAVNTSTPAPSNDEEVEEEAKIARPEGWTDETHSKSADPNYDAVFPTDQINAITITISPEQWQMMLDDMTTLYGEFGAGNGLNTGGAPAGGGPLAGGGPGLEEATDNPVWTTAESIQMDGLSWNYVGIRFKGNSSLRDGWQNGSYKLPFKLDFDRYEDEYPEIDNQRFYGFNQLTLANNKNDNSFMREVVAGEIMRDAGVSVPQSAVYNIYLDYGDGVVDLGLYAMVEVIDDTVIETQFSDDDGNVYKPDGYGSSFAVGTFAEIDFDKETNQDEADYSDILALYDALHADTRVSDPAAWRTNLEAVFDVDAFLNWLAVNTLIQNWDTYGVAYHNYFLYNNPENGLLTWIAWDMNESLTNNGPMAAPALDLDAISDDWPLIRFLLDDELYHVRYEGYVEAVSSTIFTPEQMTARYNTLAEMIAPYAEAEIGADAFETAVSQLINHVNTRQEAAQTYLATQQ